MLNLFEYSHHRIYMYISFRSYLKQFKQNVKEDKIEIDN